MMERHAAHWRKRTPLADAGRDFIDRLKQTFMRKLVETHEKNVYE
jgi:hypothetical protein